MKKVFILVVAVALTAGAQAQLGNLVRKAITNTVEQKLNLNSPKQNEQKDVEMPSKDAEDKNRVPTPEEVMAMVPPIPPAQQLADYACEQNRANPRTLKLLANPTTTFLTKMVAATASGYVVMMGAGKEGSIYNLDEQLLKELGISQEQYDAMSEEEQQKLAEKFASDLQDRYLRTAEFLASDKAYNQLMDRYSEVEKEITKKYDETDSVCRDIWQKKYGNKENPTEDDMCEYLRTVTPMQHKTVLEAMKLRKARQLEIAKKIDTYVQELAKLHPGEVFAGFYNQGGICATSYVADAARLTSLSVPR